MKVGVNVEKGWGGKAFWAFAASNSCGAGILLSRTLTYKVVHFEFDTRGRYMLLDLDIRNTSYRLINVYGSNSPAQRRSFPLSLNKYMATRRNIVLGGDFNFVENTNLDIRGYGGAIEIK